MTIENVRCFGPEQTLDLADGKGRPAQWTIILGDNGVGKTTLLQSLVLLSPFEDEDFFDDDEKYTIYLAPRMLIDYNLSVDWKSFRYGTINQTNSLAVTLFRGSALSDNTSGEEVRGIYIKSNENVDRWNSYGLADSKSGDSLVCFAYGATRRMGETSLSEKADDAPFAGLFSDDVALLNAEEWLLQADYAAHAAKNSRAQKRAADRRDKIKDVLINLLPDVSTPTEID